MDLYEMIDNTLNFQWRHGAHQKHFPVHRYPRTGFHIRPWLIMVCPHQGKYSVVDCHENRTYTVGIDEVVLSPPGTGIYVRQHTPGKQSYGHLQYSMLGAFDPWSLFHLPRTFKGKKGDEVRQALLGVTGTHDKEAKSLGDVAARKEAAFRLFGVLIKRAKVKQTKVDMLNRFSRIQPVLDYIRNHLIEPVSREDLATVANLSPSRLNVVFKEITGLAPKKYIQEQRHKKAVDLLMDTDLSIGEIAEQCGFCDQFEFSRQFKKKWGAPPLTYRTTLRQQEKLFTVSESA